MSTILIVEDDENLRLALRDNLEDRGHQVREAATIAAARVAWPGVDLVVLDIMLPDGDGYSLCRERRAAGDGVGVLMLTARTLEDDMVQGFSAGADDYLAKPYRLRELLARVDALLRRAGSRVTPLARFGAVEIDRDARRVLSGGAEVVLTRTEFDLLVFLVDRRGQALSRDQILDGVWGADVVVDGRTVDNFVSSLKKKLGWAADATWGIRTVRGVGYRFEAVAHP